MRILRSQDFISAPWKNGGGITFEIARSDSSDIFGWRLSVADVKASGPFSQFPDHQRVLAVVDGEGMKLVGSIITLAAEPMVPVHFSGAEQIYGQLVDGSCRDFNLIFDPRSFEADVVAVKHVDAMKQCFGIYVGAGQVEISNQSARIGDFIFLEDAFSEFKLSADFHGLAVFIKPL
jgi:environmental stress-induced protein Ves